MPQRLAQFKDSFSFAFVRHPLIRLVSTYQDKVIDTRHLHLRERIARDFEREPKDSREFPGKSLATVVSMKDKNDGKGENLALAVSKQRVGGEHLKNAPQNLTFVKRVLPNRRHGCSLLGFFFTNTCCLRAQRLINLEIPVLV